MSSTRRGSGLSDRTPFLALGGVTLVIVTVVAVWAAVEASYEISGTPAAPRNPFALVVNLIAGKTSWPGAMATIVVVVEALLVATLVEVVWLSRRGWRRRRERVDAAARHLASRQELRPLSHAGAEQVAKRLGVQTSSPGIVIGRAVGSGQLITGDWESLHVDIWGTRRGKTTSRAVPAILDAPGAVLVTSNKRDVVDTTRTLRADAGPVWVFDPQRVVGEEPGWWWNPLTYVTDVEKAARLSVIFSAYSKPPGAKRDAYFDPAGEELLAFLLLAAATADEPITKVYTWLSDPTDTTPADLLRDGGHALPAESVQGTINLPEKQRGGIYGTAKIAVSCLVSPAVTRWVTPADRPERRQFDPAAFVRGRETLYSLSREGQGTAGPLVTALTVATIEAAEEYAVMSPAGRLPVPMVGVLDEAANVCRWRDLPDLYSHYGSRGIVLMTILQSWAQGVEVWGETGMEKLWSAANIRVFGGGVSDTKFLGQLTELIGDYEPENFSVSVQSGQGRSHSTTTSTRTEKILEVSDLNALARGRALVFASGTRPVLVETLPWYAGPHAAAVTAALNSATETGAAESGEGVAGHGSPR